MRRTLGTAVFSGMLGVTLFGIFLTPVFFYVIDWLERDARCSPRRGCAASARSALAISPGAHVLPAWPSARGRDRPPMPPTPRAGNGRADAKPIGAASSRRRAADRPISDATHVEAEVRA